MRQHQHNYIKTLIAAVICVAFGGCATIGDETKTVIYKQKYYKDEIDDMTILFKKNETQNESTPISFKCDYKNGPNYQTIETTFFEKINVICQPLSSDEVDAQIKSEQNAILLAEQQRENEEIAKIQIEKEKKEKERVSAEKERNRQAEEAREQATRNSPAYKRNEAQLTIRRLRLQIIQAQRGMEEERRVGLISGYVNATKLHELGSFVVSAENEIQKLWQLYKANGGQASSLGEVK